MEDTILVTGANGHLGNNLVRALAAGGRRVRAAVRDLENDAPFEGVSCERVYADLLDRPSLERTLQGVDTLFQVAAVYRHWAKDPHKEIVAANLDGTRNILEIAAQKRVRKIVYVSSITALDRQQLHMNERGWNHDARNPYYHAKTVAEQLAFDLAAQHDLNLVSVLPAAMVGPHCHGHLTPTMQILDNIVHNRNRIDVQFSIHFVDIKDVVEAMLAAAERGRAGQRYILGHERSIDTGTLFRIGASLSASIKIPPQCPRPLLLGLARCLELAGRIRGRQPTLTAHMVQTYHRARHSLDLTTSRADLGYHPGDPTRVIAATMKALLASPS